MGEGIENVRLLRVLGLLVVVVTLGGHLCGLFYFVGRDWR